MDKYTKGYILRELDNNNFKTNNLKIELNKPISKIEITQFLNHNNLEKIPKNYEKFLLKCNGLKVINTEYEFVSCNYLTINQINYEIKDMCQKNIIPILFLGDDELVVLDVVTGKTYGGVRYAADEFKYLGDFNNIYDNILSTGFYPYWLLIYESQQYTIQL